MVGIPSCLYHNHQNMHQTCCNKPPPNTAHQKLPLPLPPKPLTDTPPLLEPIRFIVCLVSTTKQLSQVLEDPRWEREWEERKKYNLINTA